MSLKKTLSHLWDVTDRVMLSVRSSGSYMWYHTCHLFYRIPYLFIVSSILGYSYTIIIVQLYNGSTVATVTRGIAHASAATSQAEPAARNHEVPYHGISLCMSLAALCNTRLVLFDTVYRTQWNVGRLDNCLLRRSSDHQ